MSDYGLLNSSDFTSGKKNIVIAKTRINIGCGSEPLEGYLNFDNSPSVRLAKWPIILHLLDFFGLVSPETLNFVAFCKDEEITFGDAVKGLPIETDSVEVVYCSHVVEHVGSGQLSAFLGEIRRILSNTGTVRFVLPDLAIHISQYEKDKDANHFMHAMMVSPPPIGTWRDKLRLLLVGYRHHQWMYDAQSFEQLLSENGFDNIIELDAGETGMKDAHGIDLEERAEISLYVEARKKSA